MTQRPARSARAAIERTLETVSFWSQQLTARACSTGSRRANPLRHLARCRSSSLECQMPSSPSSRNLRVGQDGPHSTRIQANAGWLMTNAGTSERAGRHAAPSPSQEVWVLAYQRRDTPPFNRRETLCSTSRALSAPRRGCAGFGRRLRDWDSASGARKSSNGLPGQAPRPPKPADTRTDSSFEAGGRGGARRKSERQCTDRCRGHASTSVAPRDAALAVLQLSTI